MKLAIFGTGGFGREVFRLGQGHSTVQDSGSELVFVDDQPRGSVLGARVVTLADLSGEDLLLIAVGSSSTRRAIADRASHLRFGSVIASTAIIGPEVSVGEGAIFCDFTMVTASARIGRQFQCNIYSYVAHDCEIGDFVTFAPRVCCNGNVVIENDVYVGTGAVIRQGEADAPIVIGRGAVVGMGAVVTKSVSPGVTVVGNPARPFVR